MTQTIAPLVSRSINWMTKNQPYPVFMGAYKDLDKEFDKHSVVCHSQNEYVRGPIYTNTIENYFSILKRGLTGVYQHVGPQHLKRYIGEFDFRYNFRKINDEERRFVALQGIEGKRLLYRDSSMPLN